MTWFKVDDQFFNHPKVLDLDMAARGLWVTAGSYCASYLTDGAITDRQIRAIGGTRKQAEKLVAAGLWSVDDAPPSARRYIFNDWRDFQPTRDDVLSRRQEDADRKREARAEKARRRENAELSARTDDGRPDGIRSTSVRAPSALPDPTRPDPTLTGGTTSQPSFCSNARDEEAGGDPLDELAAATRRARQAGIPEPAIAEGTRRYQAKPEPKGPGLLRTLIDEAAGDLQSQEQTEHARTTRRAAITACPWCDERGMLDGHHPDGTAWSMKCTHPDDMPTPPQPPAKPEPQGVPDTAAQFLASLEARTTGGPF